MRCTVDPMPNELIAAGQPVVTGPYKKSAVEARIAAMLEALNVLRLHVGWEPLTNQHIVERMKASRRGRGAWPKLEYTIGVRLQPEASSPSKAQPPMPEDHYGLLAVGRDSGTTYASGPLLTDRASAHAMHTHPASGEAHAPETLFFGHSWISVFKPTNVQAGPPCGSRGPPAFPTHPLHIHPRPDRPARVKRAFVASP